MVSVLDALRSLAGDYVISVRVITSLVLRPGMKAVTICFISVVDGVSYAEYLAPFFPSENLNEKMQENSL